MSFDKKSGLVKVKRTIKGKKGYYEQTYHIKPTKLSATQLEHIKKRNDFTPEQKKEYNKILSTAGKKKMLAGMKKTGNIT